MDAYKNAHVNTIDAILLFLEQKQADIVPFAPAISAANLALIGKRAAIAVSLGNAYITTTDVTARKRATHATVVTTGRGLASAAVSYASSKNDALLVKEYKAFKTAMSDAKDADLPIVAGNLSKKLQPIAQELADYGVSADDLDNFAAATAQFKADAPSVKNVRNASSTENAEAEKLIAEAREIIVLQIGGMLAHIQSKIPAIYAAFVKTAKLPKPPVSSTELTVIAINDATNERLEGAAAQLVSERAKTLTPKTVKRTTKPSAKQKAKATAKEMQSRTSAMGEVVLKKNITKGQEWAITKEGYETATVTLSKLAIGKNHTFEVRLTPIKA